MFEESLIRASCDIHVHKTSLSSLLHLLALLAKFFLFRFYYYERRKYNFEQCKNKLRLLASYLRKLVSTFVYSD